MDDKIVVTNRSALTAKYGTAGFAKVKAGVAKLVTADAARGLKTRLVFLDDATQMKKYKGKAVVNHKSARQAKEAIDAIFRTEDPDYLMILGAIDVVPHGDMINPLFKPQDDDDEVAFGDLIYACDAKYSRDIATFKGPTRVVGRLPDLTGANEPSYIVSLLNITTRQKGRKVEEYSAYFGLTADSWKISSAKSLFNIFSNSSKLTLSPPSGPTHSAKRLEPLAHFINCHGGLADPTFYGQKGRAQPESLTSKSIDGKIKLGTIAAVECCYGAELYDSTIGLALPICQNYLIQGTAGYFGSTTIAYGPARSNGLADLIAQYFLIEVMKGHSVGHAALTARQQYVGQTGELDAADLKTLAQFNLLGDPSLVPAIVETPTEIPKGVEAAQAKRLIRGQNRVKSREAGELLQKSKPTASKESKSARRSPTVKRELTKIAKEAGFGAAMKFTAFDVKTPPGARKKRASKASPVATRYYVAVKRKKGTTPTSIGSRVVAVAREVAGSIVGYRIYEQR